MNFRKSFKASPSDIGSRYLLLANISILAIIFLTIFSFNLEHIFADVLWHDDGWWYYLASEGDVIKTWRGKIASLTPLRDYFYAFGMLDWGLPATRSTFVLIMSLSSASLYFIYIKIFGIAVKVALPAALIPNILPSLVGIPMGLNASYAMWGLLPVLISLQLMYYAFTKSGPPSYFYWLLGVLAYAVGLNLAASANFLIPSVLLFLGIFFIAGQNKLKTIVFALPFFILGIWQLYKQVLFSPKIPTQIPIDVVFDRSIQFLEMGSFLPFNSPVSIYVTLFLILSGLTGLLAGNSRLFVKPPHFGFAETKYRIMLVVWPFVWIVSNSVAYVVASPTFRVYDYAYISNFGIVLLQVCGLVFLWYWISQRLGWQKKFREGGLVLLLTGIIIFTGVQKLNNIDSVFIQTGLVEASSILRRHLQSLEIATNSQILIFGVPAALRGNYKVNTGYMRYLLGRKDVSALIGPDIFPNDVFAQSTVWLDVMQDFRPEKPVIAFKMQGELLLQKKLLLQTQPTGKKTLPRLQWSLFDISQPGSAPLKIASDLGMTSYYAYIENQLPAPYTSSDIGFAPGDNPGTFLSTQHAGEIAKNTGSIDSEINFDDILTLRAVNQVHPGSGHALELLFQVENKSRQVKLGYRINGKGPVLRAAIWEMAMDGDNILMKIAISDSQKTAGSITFEFFDISRWPYRPLPSKDQKNDSKIELRL